MTVRNRVASVAALALVATLSGVLIGRLTAYRATLPAPFEGSQRQTDAGNPNDTDESESFSFDVPVYFYGGGNAAQNWDLVTEEIALAAHAGIHRHIIDLPLPWAAPWERIDTILANALAADARGTFTLVFDLNPPTAWLAVHPLQTASQETQGVAYVSVGSAKWRSDAETQLEILAQHLSEMDGRERIDGCVLNAFEDGRWFRSDGYDSSKVNVASFRRWLAVRYETDDALKAAWANDGVTLETAAVPQRPNTNARDHVFFSLPEDRPTVDYLSYLSDQTASAITDFARKAKELGSEEFKVFVPYGHAFDVTWNDSGHLALYDVLEGGVDGILSPISYVDRGLGGTGGPMGPVDSAVYRALQWIVLDDTRTGIVQRDGETGVTRPTVLRVEDLANIYRRNFSFAAMHGLGLAWADAGGLGNLHDAELWQEFGSLRDVYGRMTAIAEAPTQDGSTLMVVIDEESRFYQQYDRKLNESLLLETRDAVLQAGCSVRFVLLRDVLEERVEPAAFYLFLNAFHLSENDREGMHEILAEQQAAAIWMYAPGFIDQTGDVSNISKTTLMNVLAFEEPSKSGSTYLLAGSWTNEGETFGTGEVLHPLFYVEDEEADVLAHYTDTEHASVAIKSVETGWTSIFVCEPVLTPSILRELITILEGHIYLRQTSHTSRDTLHANGGLLFIHARETGERHIDLGRSHDVQDLFDADIGWLQKRLINLSLKKGETRLLRLSPTEDDEANDRIPFPIPEDAIESEDAPN